MARALCAACIVVVGLYGDEVTEVRSVEKSRYETIGFLAQYWRTYLADRIKVGDSVEVTDRVMEGSFRETGILLHGGTGHYVKMYFVDDFHQVRCYFDRENNLVELPVVEDAQQFLRVPGKSNLVRLLR